jgi:hypothetical protein
MKNKNLQINKGFATKIVITAATVLLITILSVPAISQTATQTVRGRVYDNTTKKPLPFSTIVVLDTEPTIGTTSDAEGNFSLENVPVGRRNFEIRMVGYEKYQTNELMVTTGKEVILDIGMEEKATELEEVVVKVNKDAPLNTMASLSSRQFTVDETQRYAGGIDDPARLASSFAGVTTPSVTSNGISVRGNNPDGVLWRIEGVEVSNPNHFANLTVAGGGALTAISSNMMGNSDFFTGAFPAEYGNALSGVFDIKLKTGNSSKREYTLQAGVIGVDFATEGPFVKGNNASYNLNYRYSTMALISPILPDDAGILKYQDLSFKTNFPTKNAGTFTYWGIGALDGQEMQAADSSEWTSAFDRDNSQTSLHMFATGLSHKIRLNPSTFLNTTLSASGNGLSHNEQRLDYSLQEHPQSKAENNTWRYTIQSAINKRFSQKHRNRTGFTYNYLGYNINIEQSVEEGTAPVKIANERGNSGLLQVYTQSKINLLPQLKLNVGINMQYFMLNENYSIEPRAGIEYTINDKQSLALGYGQHSRIQQLPVYFVKNGGEFPNKDLKLMKSTHYVLAYKRKLSENLRLKIEPYYQDLTNVPVSPDSYISTINFESNMFFNGRLVSKGSGRNIGIDITFERFLHKGFYYLFTGSVFDSRYRAADGIERSTRFNKNYVFNIIGGKEWAVGRDNNNILGANIRLNYLGGNRIEPIDEQASIDNEEVVYAETSGKFAFENKFDDLPILSFTISYRKNKPKYSSVWSLQVLNATSTQEFSNHYYNLKTGKINTKQESIMIPNLSYKIEF